MKKSDLKELRDLIKIKFDHSDSKINLKNLKKEDDWYDKVIKDVKKLRINLRSKPRYESPKIPRLNLNLQKLFGIKSEFEIPMDFAIILSAIFIILLFFLIFLFIVWMLKAY